MVPMSATYTCHSHLFFALSILISVNAFDAALDADVQSPQVNKTSVNAFDAALGADVQSPQLNKTVNTTYFNLDSPRLSFNGAGQVVLSWAFAATEGLTGCVTYEIDKTCPGIVPNTTKAPDTLSCRAKVCGADSSQCFPGSCHCRSGRIVRRASCDDFQSVPTFNCIDVCSKPSARVRYALSADDVLLGHVVEAQRVVKQRGWWWASVVLAGLESGKTYSYQVIGGNWSEFGSARKFAAPGRSPIRLALVGNLANNELGQKVVTSVIAQGRPDISAAIHIGDTLPQDTGTETLHEMSQFLNMISPISSSVPYLFLPRQTESLARVFEMPMGSPESSAYAIEIGHAKVVMICTDLLANKRKNSGQLAWLRAELKASHLPESRARRPWLIIVGQRPIYCSLEAVACGSKALALRLVLEPLLKEFKVDLYFAAALNAYERTYPVSNRTLCPYQHRKNLHVFREPCATMHVTEGDAGQPVLRYSDLMLPGSWTATRLAGANGYGELTIHNDTHLQYRHLSLNGLAVDEFWMRMQRGKRTTGDLEENFLEAVKWLAFLMAVVTCSIIFVRWVHTDGIKRRNDALRELGVEVSVLTGKPIFHRGSEELQRLGSSSQ